MACTGDESLVGYTHGTQLDETRCPLVSCSPRARDENTRLFTCDHVDREQEEGVPLFRSTPDPYGDSPKAV